MFSVISLPVMLCVAFFRDSHYVAFPGKYQHSGVVPNTYHYFDTVDDPFLAVVPICKFLVDFIVVHISQCAL